MIAGKINKIKKAAKKIWKNEGYSSRYYDCLGVIEELEKLDNNEDINPLYIGYGISLYGNDIKKVADFYINKFSC